MDSKITRDSSDNPIINYVVDYDWRGASSYNAGKFIQKLYRTSSKFYAGHEYLPSNTGNDEIPMIESGTKTTYLIDGTDISTTFVRKAFSSLGMNESILNIDDNEFRTSTIYSPTIMVEFTLFDLTAPTLYRNGKMLSWNSDSKHDSGYELQYSTNSTGTSWNTITLSNSTTSYRIPDNLYYHNGFYRKWRIRRKDNDSLKYTDSLPLRKYTASGVDIYLPGAGKPSDAILDIYGYTRSDWSNTLTVKELSTPTVSLTKTSINTYSVTISSISGATGYKWGYGEAASVGWYTVSQPSSIPTI